MSIFSTVGVVCFVVVALLGIVLKIILVVRRRNLDGFHGYINPSPVDSEEDETGNWTSI